MRNVSLVLVAVLAAGCSTALQPVRITAPAPADASQTLECARRELDRMGYTVAPDQAGMSVTGIARNETPWYLRWVGYRDTLDQVSASVEGGELRVLAVSSDPNDPLVREPANDRATGATAVAQRNAQQLLSACSRQR